MILVTGATGFTGSHFINKLVNTEVDIRCFVRNTSDVSQLDIKKVEVVYGSFDDQESYCKALQGVDTLINIASLGFGHADIIVDQAVSMGVQRAVFVSTTALFTTLSAQTKAIRVSAEEKVMNSSLNYTILRPTMIYGTERDRNMVRLVSTINRYPIMPIAGDGQSLQQPIYVDDLADALIQCLDNEACYRKAYNVSGKEPLTFNEVIDYTANALSKRIVKVHVPLKPVLSMVGLYSRITRNPRIKVEQILRLNEDKAFDHSDAKHDFGFSPRTFKEGIALEVERMRTLGMI
jgi:nucleoside-diphosphate-sugar epimerase